MTSSRVRHPILRLVVLSAQGQRETNSVVFCRKQTRSVRVDDCCSCLYCDEITDGPRPSVECSIPVPPRAVADDPTGEHTEIGALLTKGTVAIAHSASVGAAVKIMQAETLRSVAIVDDNNLLVGLLRETGFLGRGAPQGAEGALGAAMSTPVAVHEQTPIRTAIRILAANHLREITVVSESGVPLGVFRDVDGLHWIAVARGTAHDDDSGS